MVEPGVAEHRPECGVGGQALHDLFGGAGKVAGPGIAQLRFGDLKYEYIDSIHMF